MNISRCLKICLLLLTILTCSCATPLDDATNPTPGGRPEMLQASFIGQDGGDYAGKQCSSGTTQDNIHIHLSGLRTDLEPLSFRVDEPARGGVWATPCDPVSNWFLYVRPVRHGATELYFKPFRDAPAGAEYKISITYPDGTQQIRSIEGKEVKQNP